MGRETYDVLTAQGGDGGMPGLDVLVFSRTLPATAGPGVADHRIWAVSRSRSGFAACDQPPRAWHVR